MPYWESKEPEVFSEGEDIHLHYICLQGHCTKTRKISLNSSSRFFFLPYQLLPRAYEVVPCCTFTIHKGYYIVLHSSHSPDYPILQPALPFHPLNKIFSALVLKSNIFMVDGLPTTVRLPQLSLKNCQSLSSSNDRWLGAVKSSWVVSLIGHLRTALADKSTETLSAKAKTK